MPTVFSLAQLPASDAASHAAILLEHFDSKSAFFCRHSMTNDAGLKIAGQQHPTAWVMGADVAAQAAPAKHFSI